MQAMKTTTSGGNKAPRADADGWRLALPLAVAEMRIAADSPVPINEQICRTLRNAIITGDLPVGTLLPTSRELAQALSVGRNTVVAAYSRLIAEGYLHSKFRRGTRVASPPQSAALAAASQDAVSSGAESDDEQSDPHLELGFHGRQALEPPITDTDRGLSLSAPDPALYPRAPLSRLLMDAFGRGQHGENDSRNAWRRFQEAIAAHFRQARGVNCEPGQIIPINGGAAAIDLAARLLLDPGHAVLVEDPAPVEIRASLRAAGARLFPMPCDSDGGNPAAAKGPPPKLVYVSPSLNFPSGVQMSAARRLAILNAAKSSGAAIFESDGFAELLYTGNRIGAIQGIDRDFRVLYYGSLENTLGPHIRAGFLVVPTNLVDPFLRMAHRVGCVPETFVLAAIAGLMESNQYAMHVKKIRAGYAQRMKLMAETCRALLPEAHVSEPHGGFHLNLELPAGLNAENFCSAAAKQGLAVEPTSRFYLRRQTGNGVAVGFGGIPERLIESAVRRIAAILHEQHEAAPHKPE
ncbi:MAG: PLP-dependent aminotransferase family protein [Rhizomicrobium sp.]|jgi:GntR family transcriptional regulator/MocR family aminotransferase